VDECKPLLARRIVLIRHVLGCHSTQETRVQSAVSDAASDICRPDPSALVEAIGFEVLIPRAAEGDREAEPTEAALEAGAYTRSHFRLTFAYLPPFRST
jgi:hypothetical protein